MTDTKQKSDLSRAFSEDGALKTHVGGQALLEGIMMRGKFNWAVAVREPDGAIYTEEHELASGKDKNSWLYWPFIRGCRAFVESLTLGYKALSIAAEHAFVEEDEEEGEAEADAKAMTGAADGSCAESEPRVDAAASEASHRADAPSQERKFSWKRDFGNPDEMIDALAAQRTLEVIDGDTGLPVRFEEEDEQVGFEDYTTDQDVADAADSSEAESEVGDLAIPDQDVADAAESSEIEGEAGDLSIPDHDAVDAADSAEAEGEIAGLDVADRDEPTSLAPINSDDPQEPTATPAPDGEQKPEKKPLLGDTEMAISMVLGLVLGVVLFIVAPAFLTNLIVGEYDEHTLAWNLVDGLLRIAVFIFYIWLIGRMSDIKRMFGYHGAEHKTIHCFEHGLPLTPENARSFPRLHVRCGTAFLIMVMIIAIFVYTITPLNALISAWGVPDGPIKLALVIVVRILLMPVIAGISYEITVKWAGSHPDNPLVKVILWPGMQMQYLTTREPDDGQIECAIAAMQLVLEREQQA